MGAMLLGWVFSITCLSSSLLTLVKLKELIKEFVRIPEPKSFVDGATESRTLEILIRYLINIVWLGLKFLSYLIISAMFFLAAIIMFGYPKQ